MVEVGQNGSEKKSGKKVLIVILVAVVILLAAALVVFVTPLKDVLLPKAGPEITLELLKGPELDEESGKYLFEVEAIVTGKPAPRVTFNRYDSPEDVGSHIITIFLQAGESFTLVAVAENSEGKATGELLLTAEGPGDIGDDNDEQEPPAAENRPPVISAIVVSENILGTGTTYTVTAQASDPDDDELTYQWSVNGGTVANLNVNPISWTTPNTPGDPIIQVVVRDGKGGEAALSKQVPVGYLRLSPVVSQSGRIIKDHKVDSGMCIFVGDDNTNRIVRGFIFFDISALEGISIKTAELRLAEPETWGNPSFMHGSVGRTGLRINAANWGDRGDAPLELEHFNLPGSTFAGYTDYDITHYSEVSVQYDLAHHLQTGINSSFSRFLIRLMFSSETSNNNDQWDGVEYQLDTISLYVTF